MKINHLFSTAVLLSALSVMFTGCDDKEFTAPVLKPEAVETPVDNINANIAAVRSFVQAKETGSKVRKTTVLPDDAGFMVEFSDGNTVSLRTKVGALADFPQQPDTYTPTVAAMPDEDGVYYWTIDGEWLTSATRAGEKINVTGAKAVTPRVSINENGDWVVDALDYGKTVLRPASRGEQISAISTVDISDPENVTVYFSDDTEPLQLAAGGGSTPPDVPITGSLRRPIDADHPAWFVHIDCWNYADPEKIISLIPEDVRPYCIFNLSLSVSHDESTGRFKVSEYGYELVKSWLRSCGEHNLWAMIQPSSGGYSHFPDVETYSQFDDEKYGMYKEFFTYPNFLGFNYCEQFWGFDSTDALYSPSWLQRVAHWNELLKLTHEYGGYLTVSFCSNQWSAPINPVAMIKRNPDFARTTALYPENFIYCEKYTQSSMFYEVEAASMGVWLSGHAGNYGLRFDQCAFNEKAAAYYGIPNWEQDNTFPVALGAALTLEHITLTGQTVYDGPELIWRQDFKETGIIDVSDGYKTRSWDTFAQFRNINIDLYRKIIDGTIRLLTRDEVIARCKYAVIQDIAGGSDLDKYCLPKWFHQGIGALDHDGGREENFFYLRKTGRYPAIPVVAEFAGDMAKKFKYVRNQSEIINSWSNTSDKTRELNRVFPSEYTGDLFAGRHENTWVTYNPWNSVKSAKVPFKYNTCENVEFTLETFATTVWKEYSDRVTFYLTKYQEDGKSTRSIIKINGATSQPSVQFTPRAEATAKVSESWADGVLTLTVDHNGPVDITVNCSGNGTGRLTEYTYSTIQMPGNPQLYHGPRQHEAEVFDFKNIEYDGRVTSGYDKDVRNYTGQGYLRMGTGSNVAVRDEVSVLTEGRYAIKFRYRAESADVTNYDLYVNGEKVGSPKFTQSGGDKTVWYVNSTAAYLNAGSNVIELKANATGSCELYLDNVIVESVE